MEIVTYVFIAFAIIAVRLFFIQIVEHGAWVAKADEQHTLLETIVARRGEIYMMDKGEPVPVVLNQTAYQIVIDPTVTEREPIEKALKTYHKAIGADPNDSYSYCQLAEIFGQRNNERKQITYYKTAAKMGNKRAQDWLQNNGHSW